MRNPMRLPALLAGAFLTVSLAACNTSGGVAAGGTPPGQSPGPAGTGVVAMGTAMTARTGESVTVTAFTAGVEPIHLVAPSPGKQCDEVTITLHNGSPNQWTRPGWEMSLIDANGQKYTWQNGAWTCPNSDTVDAVVAGGSATQHLFYLVPDGGPLDLNWSPAFEGEVFQSTLR